MIKIDMRLPRNCYVCPCNYTIETGPYEGEQICSILSYKGESVENSVIGKGKRPDYCPIIPARTSAAAPVRDNSGRDDVMDSALLFLANNKPSDLMDVITSAIKANGW